MQSLFLGCIASLKHRKNWEMALTPGIPSIPGIPGLWNLVIVMFWCSELSEMATILQLIYDLRVFSKCLQNSQFSLILKVFSEYICNCLCLCICLCRCVFVGQIVFSHQSDQMSQSSQVSRISLICVFQNKKVSHSPSEWMSAEVTLSCTQTLSWQLQRGPSIGHNKHIQIMMIFPVDDI